MAERVIGSPSGHTGGIPHDFGLPEAPLLRPLGRARLLRPGLFPELRLQRGLFRPDAVLTLMASTRPRPNASHRGWPVLRAIPALLRGPAAADGRERLETITLVRQAAASQHRQDRDQVGWAGLILRQRGWLTPALAQRAAQLRSQLAARRIGGTWWAPSPGAVEGCAVVFATPNAAATRAMLQRALDQAGAHRTVLVARHPAAWARACRRLGVRLVEGPVDPWPALEQAASLHADAGSEVAVLAALLGRTVQGAGAATVPEPDADRLAAALLILGSRYTDPFSGASLDCEAYLDLAAGWRRSGDGHAGQEQAAIACCVGISFWKRRRIAEMLGAGSRPAFRKTAEAALAAARRRGGGIAVWPSRAPAGLEARAAAAGIPVSRVEDGFVRSVGLGADFLPPLSIVLDRAGIYYDATRSSDLERLLATAAFPPALLARAAALRARMVRDKVTKYNLPPGAALDLPRDRRVLLVPGQVADDRSVLLGGGGVLPGLDLLRRVRAAAPDAYIVYKPHPDVEAGHRPGALADAAVLRHADRVLRGGSMADLLGAVAEVHTLTSLTGFEALLRGKPVATYGQPFYAGWGLTRDANPPARRGRPLTIDELVAGTLILYPRYIDPVTLLPCGPEIVLDRLAGPALRDVNLLVKLRRLQGRLWVMGQRTAGQRRRPARVRNIMS